MTERERQIIELLRENPMLPQAEIAQRLGITRSSVGVHLANLSKKGYILGKGYVLAETGERYVVGIGAANIDLMGRSREKLVMEDSNPGYISMSVGGVTHNICENAARMGAPAKLITVIGDDIYGQKIRQECEIAGIDTSGFMVAEGQTSSTYLSLHDADGEMALALSDMRVLQLLSIEFLKSRHRLLAGASVIVMDAGLPEEILKYVAATYGETVPVFVDPVSTSYARKLIGGLAGCHTFKPNRIETEIIAGMKVDSPAALRTACEKLIKQGLTRIMVSMGKDGCFYLDRTGRAMRVKGEPVRQVVNATGAGDAFVGGLVYAQLQGLSPEETMLFSTAAARMAIAHQNTINPNISAQNVWDTVQRDRLVVENG